MRYRVVIEDTMETHFIVEADSRGGAEEIAVADRDKLCLASTRTWFDVIERDVFVNQPKTDPREHALRAVKAAVKALEKLAEADPEFKSLDTQIGRLDGLALMLAIEPPE